MFSDILWSQAASFGREAELRVNDIIYSTVRVLVDALMNASQEIGRATEKLTNVLQKGEQKILQKNELELWDTRLGSSMANTTAALGDSGASARNDINETREIVSLPPIAISTPPSLLLTARTDSVLIGGSTCVSAVAPSAGAVKAMSGGPIRLTNMSTSGFLSTRVPSTRSVLSSTARTATLLLGLADSPTSIDASNSKAMPVEKPPKRHSLEFADTTGAQPRLTCSSVSAAKKSHNECSVFGQPVTASAGSSSELYAALGSADSTPRLRLRPLREPLFPSPSTTSSRDVSTRGS